MELCVNCDQPAVEGCQMCDACLDEANRLWQAALHARNVEVQIARELRRAEATTLKAFERFNSFNSIAANKGAQRAQLVAV